MWEAMPTSACHSNSCPSNADEGLSATSILQMVPGALAHIWPPGLSELLHSTLKEHGYTDQDQVEECLSNLMNMAEASNTSTWCFMVNHGLCLPIRPL